MLRERIHQRGDNSSQEGTYTHKIIGELSMYDTTPKVIISYKRIREMIVLMMATHP
jgi:hypothetical protein